MKPIKQKYYAFNTQLFLTILLFVIFGVLSICSAVEHEIGSSIGFAVATLLPIFVFLTSPLYIAFSDEEIEIIYVMGQRESVQWNNIRSIYSRGSWISRGGGLPRYVIVYPTQEKRVFFVCGNIPKTRKTKEYINQYYRKDIE